MAYAEIDKWNLMGVDSTAFEASVLTRIPAMWRSALLIGLAAAGVGAADAPPRFRALVFSKTTGFRHGSIPNAVAAIRTLGTRHGFAVDATESAAVFTDSALARYQVVIFALTTGDVLDPAQQAAFERFIRGGRGYVGIHSASDTEYEWPWYGGLVGAYFNNHPAPQTATIKVEEAEGPESGFTRPTSGAPNIQYLSTADPVVAETTLLSVLFFGLGAGA